jgi:hypothetical protein
VKRKAVVWSLMIDKIRYPGFWILHVPKPLKWVSAGEEQVIGSGVA